MCVYVCIYSYVVMLCEVMFPLASRHVVKSCYRLINLRLENISLRNVCSCLMNCFSYFFYFLYLLLHDLLRIVCNSIVLFDCLRFVFNSALLLLPVYKCNEDFELVI